MHNAAQSYGTDVPNLSTDFIQYGADIDHNICMLNGHSTFHGMGKTVLLNPVQGGQGMM